MLIEADRTGKTKSIFKCDRCNKILIADQDERFRISVTEIPMNQRKTKKWDLCKKCYAALYRGIEKKNGG